MILLPSSVCSNLGQCNVFELLQEIGYDMNLTVLAYSCSQDVDWSRLGSSLHPYDFDARSVSCLETSVERGPKRLNDGVVLVGCILPAVSELFGEGEPMSLSEAKS